MKVLDIGPGNVPKKDATHCVDFNDEFQLEIESKGKKFKKWDCNKLPLPYDNQEFDLVYMDNSLEHLDIDVIPFFREINRITKFRGHFIVKVPSTMYWYQRVSYLFGYIPPDFFLAHKQHYTTSVLVEYLRQADFKIRPRNNFKMLISDFLKDGIEVKARKFQ
ncbi:MAG: methyltransferase domain-containing protein [Candidatus Omnitrophica bacterium]|nr:methyltransferase domain-containing protein [Candidatus Omnitrophota bacterium]